MGNSQAKQKKKQQEELKKLEEAEKKIGIAVYFLAGENMQKIPTMEKKIFLRKKGLTEEMVEQAFKRFEAKQKQKEKEKLKQLQSKATDIKSALPKAESLNTGSSSISDPEKKQNK